MSEFVPSLEVSEGPDGVRLELEAITSAEGSTLQDAGDELVRKVLTIVMALGQQGGLGGPSLRPDPRLLNYLWKLSAIAVAGGDIRDALF